MAIPDTAASAMDFYGFDPLHRSKLLGEGEL